MPTQTQTATKPPAKRPPTERPPRCRVCGCTEREPCNPPCGWERGNGPLCDTCADAVDALMAWATAARRANLTALLREFRECQVAERLGAAS